MDLFKILSTLTVDDMRKAKIREISVDVVDDTLKVHLNTEKFFEMFPYGYRVLHDDDSALLVCAFMNNIEYRTCILKKRYSDGE